MQGFAWLLIIHLDKALPKARTSKIAGQEQNGIWIMSRSPSNATGVHKYKHLAKDCEKNPKEPMKQHKKTYSRGP